MDPARSLQLRAAPLTLPKRLVLAVSIALVVACALPALTATRGRLTSDESLYAAEALNIYLGRGPEYSTGRPITHRAPLYPVMLSAAFEAGGVSLETASWVPRIATVLNALLILILARRLAGSLAGLVAGVTAASSSYVNGLGATLFLDTVQSTFILASVLLLWHSSERRSTSAACAAGALMGLAILIKESAILMAPLPLIAALVGGADGGWRQRLAGWTGALVLTAGPWWVWVFAQSGSIYMLGSPNNAAVRAIGGLACLGAATLFGLLWWRGCELGPRSGAAPRLAGAGLMVVWGGAAMVGLEWQSWSYPQHYLTNVPAYLGQVVIPAAPAFPLMAAALAWAGLRTGRRDRGGALLVSAAGLLLPWLLFFANRGLSLRDALPFLYFGIVGFGCGAAWLIEWGDSLTQGGPSVAGHAGRTVVGVALLVVVAQGLGHVARAAPVGYQDDWDNVIAQDTAAWIEQNVPAGAPVMSTRLYYSQVFFLTGGAYQVHQIPTVLVDVHPGSEPLVTARSTLFRWEELPARGRAQWLYLARYGVKSYYIGLAEEDLIADLRERGTRYLVLNTSDFGFSSQSYLTYLDANRAFTRVYERQYSSVDETVIYEVDLEQLAPIASRLKVTSFAYESLTQLVGGPDALDRVLAPLNDGGFEVDP